MSNAIAVVLAAGKGTRMESDLPKVLIPACEKPLVEYVLDAIDAAGIQKSIVVVGYQAEKVKSQLKDRENISFVHQTEQLGTGHAVQVCQRELESHDGPVFVLTGDSPLVQASSLKALLDVFERDNPACILGTLHKDDPFGLGRILRDSNNDFQQIVEEKDASPEQKLVTEVNMSTYVFDCQKLVKVLGELKDDNRQKELYITDCPGILKKQGNDVRALPVLKACESLSVNNLEDLAAVEKAIRDMAEQHGG